MKKCKLDITRQQYDEICVNANSKILVSNIIRDIIHNSSLCAPDEAVIEIEQFEITHDHSDKSYALHANYTTSTSIIAPAEPCGVITQGLTKYERLMLEHTATQTQLLHQLCNKPVYMSQEAARDEGLEQGYYTLTALDEAVSELIDETNEVLSNG